MSQYPKKKLFIELNAEKELLKLPYKVRKEFEEIFGQLKHFGTLTYPKGKKLTAYNLFEARVRKNGTYRCIYSYINNEIVILSLFRKKTQKTPLQEIQKALRRRNNIR